MRVSAGTRGRVGWAAFGVAVAIAAVVVAPGPASAFLFADTFDRSAVTGGGGGRHFTGSFTDGYTCAVCHGGGEAPVVTVTGWPGAEYVPGMTYDIAVGWDMRAAAAIEIVAAEGRAAGSLVVVPDAELDP